MKHSGISIKVRLEYEWKRAAEGAERKVFCPLLLFACIGIFVVLLVPAAVLAISAEARQVEIKYYGDIQRGNPKAAIQFLSPAKGWVGISGMPTAANSKPPPALLTTTGGIDHLHPVTSLKMPADYIIDSIFFLDAKLGWVVTEGSEHSRLYRTEDGGKSWLELNPNLSAWILWIRFFSPSLGLMSSVGGFWRTEDGGKHWRKMSFPDDWARSFFFDPLGGWVAGNGVVWHTSDGGKTWKVQYDAKVKHGPQAGIVFWGMQFISPTEGWIVGQGQWLLHTRDAGNTWEHLHVNNPKIGPYDSFQSVHFLNPIVGVVSGEHYLAELYSKRKLRHMSPMELYFYKPYLLVTFDGGRTWRYHSLPVPIGQWTQAGRSLLYGIHTVNSLNEQAGIIEVQIAMPKAGKGRPPRHKESQSSLSKAIENRSRR